MSLTPLVNNIKKRVNNKIFQLRKVRKYMNQHDAILVYKQTILPIFDYAVFLLLISVTHGIKHDLLIYAYRKNGPCKRPGLIGLHFVEVIPPALIQNKLFALFVMK